jgi:serine protease Do
LGFVLGGDGRILTMLSLLGDGNGIDARYADGSVVNVRVGHADRAWDLALLVPQIGRWEHGLIASTSDPLAKGSQVHTFAKRGRSVHVASVVLQGRSEVMGGDGQILRDALDISTRISDPDLGAPLVDGMGRVLGMVSRACKLANGEDIKNCRRAAYGAPIGAIRQFLRDAPANAIPPTAWLGIQGASDHGTIALGVRVVRVHPGSPASEAGLHDAAHGGNADVIVAVDGSPVQSPEKLAAMVRELAVGQEVEVILLREGRFHIVSVKLATAPTGTGATE